MVTPCLPCPSIPLLPGSASLSTTRWKTGSVSKRAVSYFSTPTLHMAPAPPPPHHGRPHSLNSFLEYFFPEPPSPFLAKPPNMIPINSFQSCGSSLKFPSVYVFIRSFCESRRSRHRCSSHPHTGDGFSPNPTPLPASSPTFSQGTLLIQMKNSAP